MHDYQQLELWQSAMELAADSYSVTRHLPAEEKYGLTSQIRRSAVSIASNVAEGAGRATPADFRRLIRVAAGSTCELETQFLIARKTGLLTPAQTDGALRTIVSVKKMLTALDKRLTRTISTPIARYK